MGRGGGIGLGKAALVGALVGVLAVIAGAAVVTLKLRSEMSPERVLIVLGCRDADGLASAGVIAVATRSGITLIDADKQAFVPGVTTVSTAGEAYAFGGGQAVLRAVGGQGAADAAIGLPEEAWSSAMGRVTVTIPQDLDAFAGDHLFRFREGTATVGPEEARALLASSSYVSNARQRIGLRTELAEAALNGLGAHGVLESAMENPDADSTLSPTGVRSVLSWLPGVLARAQAK